jgi:DNA-binding NarL/FixJ family response regulator
MTRIVLTDDNAESRGRLRRLLELQEGFEVIGEASNGREAIALARELRPDVMLMDLRMPGLDGFSAACSIVRELPATRIFILTADAGDLDAAEVARRGLQGLLTKDHSVSEIIVAIRPAERPSRSDRLRMMPRRLFGLA